ncbi:MAG: hypothetical protein KDD10_11345 [Phaeodactylibacter sp.]|nr:hypothetical protein [Phaeodactylibacter sp.]MCB9295010.1 hypothetical protein [Lewinellaceae bacterium]
MEKYLNYLLTDIAAATANVPVLTFESSDEGPAFIPLDEEEKMARREILGDWIGLRQELFPPAGRLSDAQIARLLDAMAQCLDVYNFIPHFPAGLPARKRYEVLVAQLGKEVPILMHNAWQLDFCEYEPRTCPFGESFCQCKVYEKWLTQAEDEELPDEETMEQMMENKRLPGFLFDKDDDDYDEDDEDDYEDDDFFFEADNEYYDDEYGYDEEYGFDEEDEDEDGPFLSDFPGSEPGPDDGGRWN